MHHFMRRPQERCITIPFCIGPTMEPTGWSWTHWIEEQICAHNVSRERWNESQEWSGYEVIIVSDFFMLYHHIMHCINLWLMFSLFRNFLFVECGMSKGKGNQIWRDMFWPIASGDESPRNRLLKTDDVISLHDQKLGRQLWLCPIQTLKFCRLWLWRFPDLFLLWLFPGGFVHHLFPRPVSNRSVCWFFFVHVAMHKVNQVLQILFDFRFQRFRL